MTSLPAHKPLDKPQVSDKTHAPAAPQAVNITFALHAPGAKRVCLCGEFNAWSPNANPLAPKAGGRWEISLSLRPGRYQYKYVVDDVWLHDPDARENVPNQLGSLNSVIEVRI